MTRALALLLLAGCANAGGPPPEPTAPAAPSPEVESEGPTLDAEATDAAQYDLDHAASQGAWLVELHCGSCHRSDLPSALNGALEVFDLLEPGWFEALTPEELLSSYGRLDAEIDDPADLVLLRTWLNARLNALGTSPIPAPPGS